jgi:hypothetical protein
VLVGLEVPQFQHSRHCRCEQAPHQPCSVRAVLVQCLACWSSLSCLSAGLVCAGVLRAGGGC